MTATERVLKNISERWESAGLRWVVVGQLPNEKAGSGDVDLAIHPKDLRRAVDELNDEIKRQGWLLLQVLQHEVTCWYAVVGIFIDGYWHTVYLDICSDYMIDGRVLMSGERLCSERVRGDDQMMRPNRETALCYATVKAVKKDDFSEARLKVLGGLAASLNAPPNGCFPTLVWAALFSAIKACDKPEPSTIEQAKMSLRAAPQRRLQEMKRIVRRVLLPSGLHLVFTGPDGAGKSTTIRGLTKAIEGCFRRIDHIHLFAPSRNKTPGPAMPPYAKPNRGWAGSILKTLLVIAQSHYLFLTHIITKRWRSSLIINDRHSIDLWADPGRFRVQLPDSLLETAFRLSSRADVYFMLYASAKTLQARTDELSALESAQQVERYKQVGKSYGIHCISTDNPLLEVQGTCVELVLLYLSNRQQHRGWPW